MAVFSGFNESHEPPPSGDAHGIVLAHKVDTFCIFVLYAVALAAAGAIRSK